MKQLEFAFLKEIKIESECLYRFIGQCKGCKKDFEKHYPNNLDCPRYHSIGEYSVYIFDQDKI